MVGSRVIHTRMASFKSIFLLLLVLGLLGFSGWWAFQTFANRHSALPDGLFPQPLRDINPARQGRLTSSGILAATNAQRLSQGLPAFSPNPQLDQAALAKAQDILARQYFEHVAPDGTKPADLVSAAGYQFIRVGENLALGNFASDSSLVDAWMGSPGHRANILHDGYNQIGLAAVPGEYEGQEVWVAVQTFALPLSACPTVDPGLNQSVSRLTTELNQQQGGLSNRQQRLSTLQSQSDQLNSQISSLVATSQAKLDEGNAAIARGNSIYAETQDPGQAQPDWDQGRSLQKESQALYQQSDNLQAELKSLQSEYEGQRAEFNRLVDNYNRQQKELESLTNRLNQQIRAFNSCVSG